MVKDTMKKIHNTAIIEGDVELGEGVYVCAYAVIRGDEGKIKIGNKTNIQEHCTVHGKGVTIGNEVALGHNSIIHGCRIGNNVLVGMGAIVMDNADIGNWCIIGAGALVSPGTVIESNSLVFGVPAKRVRKITEEDKKLIKRAVDNYFERLKK